MRRLVTYLGPARPRYRALCATTLVVAACAVLTPGLADAERAGDRRTAARNGDDGNDALPRLIISPDLRSKPDAKARLLEKLDAGKEVRYLYRRGRWVAVSHNDRIAWARLAAKKNPKLGASELTAAEPTEFRPGELYEVTDDTWLRKRHARAQSSDLELTSGTMLRAHASDMDGNWLLVEDGDGELGWVRARECARTGGRIGPGADVVVDSSGFLRSRASRRGRALERLADGDRAMVSDVRRDWAMVTTEDGSRGWFPIERLRTAVARRAEAPVDPVFHPGARVRVARSGMLRAGPGPREPTTWRARKGNQMTVLRASGEEDERWILGIDGEGRWGWISSDRLAPLGSGIAIVDSINADTGGGKSKKPPIGSASLFSLFSVTQPIGEENSNPRYTLDISASLSRRLSDRFGVGLVGTLQLSRRKASIMDQERNIEGASFQALGNIGLRISKNWQTSLAAGYTFSERTATTGGKQFLGSSTGPTATLTLSGQLSERFSLTGVGTIEKSRSTSMDFEGSSQTTYVGDLILGTSITSWLRTSVVAEVVAGPSTVYVGVLELQFPFLKHFSFRVGGIGVHAEGDTSYSVRGRLAISL